MNKLPVVIKLFQLFDLLPKKDDSYGMAVSCVDKKTLDSNLRAMFEYLKKRGAAVTVFTFGNNPPPEYVGEHWVKLFSIKGLFRLARTKNIFLANSIAYEFTQKLGNDCLPINQKRHTVVNLWHGVAIKKIQKLTGWKEYMSESKFYAGLTVSSEADKKLMEEAFYPIDNDKVWITGLARYDMSRPIYDKLPPYYKTQADAVKNLLLDRKLVLYAPTWRIEGELYLPDTTEVNNIKQILKRHNAVLGLRIHSFSRSGDEESLMDLIDNKYIIDLGPSICQESIIVARYCDLLITDYSSIYMDSLYLNKPVICFPYDLESYETGLVYKLEDVFPGEIVYTFEDLVIQVDSILSCPFVPDEKYKNIQQFFFQYLDSNNCQRVLSNMAGD